MNAEVSLTNIPVRDLVRDDANVRKSKAADKAAAELLASIATHGVLAPLLVKQDDDGHYLVSDGCRRLEAVHALIARGDLPDDYTVPCRILDEQLSGLEAGMIGNLVRENMHPLDEHEAFSALYDTHQVSIADIAARFGKKEIEVRQRLALGNVHPTIRQACRNGDFGIDVLTAFAGTSNQEHQLKVYNGCSHDGTRRISHWQVRDKIEEETYDTDHPHVKLIDIDEYAAAGGRMETDLFGAAYDDEDDEDPQEHEPIRLLIDTDIVDRMAMEKLEAHAADKCKGWKWVETHLDFNVYDSDFTRVSPAGKRYTKEEKANLGVVVTINGAGIYKYEGLARKEDAASAKKAKKATAAKSTKGEEQGPSYSQSLEHDLSLLHLEASKLALSKCADRALPLSALYFAMCWQMFTGDWRGSKIVNVTAAPNRMGASCDDELQSLRDTLFDFNDGPTPEWLDEQDELASFKAFLKLPYKDQEELAAWATIMVLQATKDTDSHLRVLLYACSANLADYWRPKADSFFSRIKQADRLQIATEILGEEPPPDVKRMKKDALSLWLEDKVRAMPAKTCWMPEGFRG